MKKGKYHHGNLRNDLIKAGLVLIAKEGQSGLSLRKAATMCGVSHAAPRSHFDNKEDFLEAIEQSVIEDIVRELKKTIDKNKEKNKLIYEYGETYIKYFIKNPQHYIFMVKQKEFGISTAKNNTKRNVYKPFKMLREVVETVLGEENNQEEILHIVLYLWAFFNGLTGHSVYNSKEYGDEWLKVLEGILKQNKWCNME